MLCQNHVIGFMQAKWTFFTRILDGVCMIFFVLAKMPMRCIALPYAALIADNVNVWWYREASNACFLLTAFASAHVHVLRSTSCVYNSIDLPCIPNNAIITASLG